MKKKRCVICGKRIEVMCMQGTGVCSENCRKDRDGETGDRPPALVNAPVMVKVGKTGRVPHVRG